MSTADREDFPDFDGVPMTHRSGATVARAHGYGSLAGLIASLPENASVLDVGAGASTLGREVARLRPDVQWTNLDYQYDEPDILATVRRGAPANLTHVPGDATRLDEQFAPGSFDAVFSYWLFPHLSVESPEPALVAARGLFRVTKDGGQMAVGPKRWPVFAFETQLQRSWRTVKTDALDEEEFAAQAVRHTRLPAFARPIYRAMHHAALDTYGRGAYMTGNSLNARIFDPSEGRYISQYRPRAMALMGAFAVRALVETIRPNRSQQN